MKFSFINCFDIYQEGYAIRTIPEPPAPELPGVCIITVPPPPPPDPVF